MPFRWRPDGDYVADANDTRRMMQFLMPTRNESVVYFEQKIPYANAETFLTEQRLKSGERLSILHLVIWAAGQALAARPRLNRFVAGRRIYQRRGIWISFSGKKAKTDNHPIMVVKKQIDPTQSLLAMVREIEGGIQEGRSGKASSTDKEVGFLLKLPVFLLNLLIRLQFRLDRWGLLPAFFMRSDPMYASLFIANLGSLGMDAGYHHLFEYGNIPIFCTIGQVRDEVVAENGLPVVRKMITLRYTFDERTEDGLYCLKALQLIRDIVEKPQETVRV